jgi:hypothetical protein
MMDTSWYPIAVPCPKCEKITVVFRVTYSADGELRFDCFCKDCKLNLEWKTYASQLAHSANCYDFETHLEKIKLRSSFKPNGKPPITPLVPPLAGVMTDDDRKFEHDCGIDTEGV